VTSIRLDKASNPDGSPRESLSAGERKALDEMAFMRMIAIERKRTERSGEPFLLMLLEAVNHQGSEGNGGVLDSVVSALLSYFRETDVIGWYKDRTTAGVVFTGLVAEDKISILNLIQGRVSNLLRDKLTPDQFNQVSISFYFFPDDWDDGNFGPSITPALYPDLLNPGKGRRFLLTVKRAIDIVGSALALIISMPALYLVGIAIKVSSKGPMLFRQKRVGQYGKRFTVLKFRTMHIDNDRSVHKQFVTKLIANEAEPLPSDVDGEGVYKLTNDTRVTRLGRILRRTSLDEVPQFLNVLMGDMSLVGPRPAVLYELKAYKTWHRRRVLDFKPGITGLWQVFGRSRVKFDEMVRLDLKYATSWSLWLDFKILLLTPLAVIRGAGAH
jgi:lipopolysaccharide/colanic/teichoic acid biosynthesis glycosyltransferase